MGHYEAAIETLKKKKQPSIIGEKLKGVNASSKSRANIILFALVKSGNVEMCLSEMSNSGQNRPKTI